MDIAIVNEDENPMLHRRDVTFELVHEDATPERLSVRDSLAAKLKTRRRSSCAISTRSSGCERQSGPPVSTTVPSTHRISSRIEQNYMLNRNKIAADER